MSEITVERVDPIEESVEEVVEEVIEEVVEVKWDWKNFFTSNFSQWDDNLISFLNSNFLTSDYFAPPETEEMTAEFDHWYQQFLSQLLVRYSKENVGELKEKYGNSRLPKHLKWVVEILKDNFEESDDIIWHDMYSVLVQSCTNRSIATIYKEKENK